MPVSARRIAAPLSARALHGATLPAWLSSAIEAAILPPGCTLTLAALALVLRALRRPRAARASCAAGLLLLALASAPRISVALATTLESRHAAAPLARADAIAVLGGGLGPATAPRTRPDLGDASDRVWEAARLYHAGVAPRIIAVGGRAKSTGVAAREADEMATLLGDFGVPRAALLLERESTNTWENCEELARIAREAGFARIVLVTSALHMPRARFACERTGIPELLLAPTDFEATLEGRSGLITWLPSAQALERSSAALREYSALAAYWMRGRVERR